MRLPLAVALASLIACGGGDDDDAPGPALAPSQDLVVVAHLGDELRFIAPDVGAAVARGGIATIYVTAGVAERGGVADEDAMQGVKAAYAGLSGAKLDDWQCGPILLADHHPIHCRLDAANASLIFLGYPDGGHAGDAADSLLHLWEGVISSAPSAIGTDETYSQGALIAAVAEVISATTPTTLRTLEIAGSHGDDHSDHMLVGALSVLGAAKASRHPELLAYRGDNIAGEPANADASTVERSTQALAFEAACTTGCAPCGTACSADKVDASDLALSQRRYPIAMQAPATGRLRIGDTCVHVERTGNNGSMVDCAIAEDWEYSAVGVVRSAVGAGICLDAILTGELIGGTCGANAGPDGPGEQFYFDDEGHLWAGVVPAPQSDMARAHLDCVAVAGGRPRGVLCGGADIPTVEILSAPAVRRGAR